ncbi:DinB family protein [Chloroflexota bacterium]
MNAVALIVYSLQTSLEILQGVTADLTQEQADWLPPGTANPIGALYWHVISGTDQAVHGWGLGRTPLFETAGWEAKVVLASEPFAEGDHAGRLRSVRVELEPMHEYAAVVAEAALAWLASLDAEDLDRKLETPIGELNLGQMLASFVVWHIDAHCGEISALKGCQGARGYPF